MKRTGYAIVDIASGEVLTTAASLPTNPSPPGNPRGRIATFERIGQEAGGYRCVERLETEPVHEYQFSAGTTTAFNGSAVVVDHKWSDTPLAEAVAARVAEIKTTANELIIGRYPDWKQANMTARAVELQDVWRRNGSWSTTEQADSDALNAAWAWIKSVREQSNKHEAEVKALGTVAKVAAWTGGWLP